MIDAATDSNAFAARGRRLEYLTIAWNLIEGAVAIWAATAAGSVALLAFGIDSLIELVSASALLWRMSIDVDAERRERFELQALRIVGACFIALAAYVAYDSIGELLSGKGARPSLAGIIVACAAMIIMPLLGRAKRRVAAAMDSKAMDADATQSNFCAYLSAITLAGLFLNAVFGLWWADPVAALVMVPIIGNEGLEALRGQQCDDCGR